MAQVNIKAADSKTVSLSSRLTSAALAALLGSFILIGVGFAHSDIIHNAAHDSRHSFAFPCH